MRSANFRLKKSGEGRENVKTANFTINISYEVRGLVYFANFVPF